MFVNTGECQSKCKLKFNNTTKKHKGSPMKKSPSDSVPQSPLKSSLAAIESQNVEDFVVALKDGSPPMTVVQLAQQGSFIRRCVMRLSA